MAITKKFLKTRPVCKVKFCLSPEEAEGANSVCLVGEFNEWQEDAHPMRKTKDGGFSVEVDLPLGLDYQFRYRTDAGVWINDPEADAYVPGPYSGVENFLVKA